MPRFTTLIALLAVVVSLVAGPAALAQEATPAAGVRAALGYPELRITITDGGFEAPDQVPAGLVLLTVTNASSNTRGTADVALVMPPAGVTSDDVAALFGPHMASPAATEAAAPGWIYQATWAGGVIVPPGQTLQAVVDLPPGSWLLINDTPGSAQSPRPLAVTGEAAASPTAAANPPAADVDVTLQEYAFLGLDRPIPAGPHIWKLTNSGKQPHVMLLFKGPAGITMDEFRALLQLPAQGTPPPSVPYTASDFDFVQPGAALLSAGQTMWLALDLPPGTYIALCFIPDEATGAPHAVLGMIQVFTVGTGAATPAA
ncbi:MAG: hypothetical protein IT338_19460 [Thermomicrobiales bacterium]|nr:hypothetical protein [Thermomicrobiales bacterium]